jgi:hypothetical protein
MKMISNRIYSTPTTASLEEVAKKAQDQAPPRDVDQILADLAKAKGQVKTASKTAGPGEAPTKEAEAPEEVEVVAVDDDPEVMELPPEEEGPPLEPLGEEESKAYFPEEEAPPPATAAKKGVTLKVAKKHDFRDWEAEDVVKAWGRHGDMKTCVAAMKGQASDPQLYCGLLRTAGDMAMRVVKRAAAEAAKEEKTAGKEGEAKRATFRKLAKLTGKDLQLLRQYWANLYGEDYVTAMLGEYAG